MDTVRVRTQIHNIPLFMEEWREREREGGALTIQCFPTFILFPDNGPYVCDSFLSFYFVCGGYHLLRGVEMHELSRIFFGGK